MWPLFKKIQMITTLYFPFDSSEKSEPLKESRDISLALNFEVYCLVYLSPGNGRFVGPFDF